LLACCVQAQTLKKISSIDLPGLKGQRFDYLTMDDEDHWLLRYEEFYRTVREVNRKLPRTKRFRLLLGDPPAAEILSVLI